MMIGRRLDARDAGHKVEGRDDVAAGRAAGAVVPEHPLAEAGDHLRMRFREAGVNQRGTMVTSMKEPCPRD